MDKNTLTHSLEVLISRAMSNNIKGIDVELALAECISTTTLGLVLESRIQQSCTIR